VCIVLFVLLFSNNKQTREILNFLLKTLCILHIKHCNTQTHKHTNTQTHKHKPKVEDQISIISYTGSVNGRLSVTLKQVFSTPDTDADADIDFESSLEDSDFQEFRGKEVCVCVCECVCVCMCCVCVCMCVCVYVCVCMSITYT